MVYEQNYKKNILRNIYNLVVSILNLMWFAFSKFDSAIIVSERDIYPKKNKINHFQYLFIKKNRILKIIVPQYDSNSMILVKPFKYEFHSVLINLPSVIYSKLISTSDTNKFNFIRTKLAKYVIQKFDIKNIFFTSYYDNYKQSWLRAAEETVCNTIEIQHGHIYKESKEYYKSNNLIKPDKLLIWDDRYRENISKCFNCVTVGLSLVKLKLNIPTKENSILLIDQYTKHDELVVIINLIKEKHKKYNIYLKPHPRSYTIKNYINSLSNLGVEVVKTNRKILDIAHNFDYVIGFYSTGLVESALSGVNTYSICENKNKMFSIFDYDHILDFKLFPNKVSKRLHFGEFNSELLEKNII